LLRDEDGALVVRVVNRTPQPAEVTVRRDGVEAHGEHVDLVGGVVGAFDGRALLRAWELRTLRFVDL
jgi:hypothetical protein